MTLETDYKEALELTHQMLASAKAQDWDTLNRTGARRAAIVEKAVQHRGLLPAPEQQRIAAIIVEIEQESAEIIERVQSWQEHVKILLRMNKRASSP